jgi:23S rRNA U2552 (ribose-2'-O)-methylase RlmE/FtsJ
VSLWSEYLDHRGRPAWKWTHYLPAYERHLARFVNQPVTLLEIGCGQGGSLQLWKKYLGPFARIVGVDIVPACARFAEAQIEVRIGDQSDPEFLHAVIEEFGPFDVVIDDGSHLMSHTLTSFDTLYEHTTGVYAVEDLHTAYWEDFEGGLRRRGTFIEHFKHLVDELHAEYTHGALSPTAFTESTLSMHVYESLIVFEKGRPWIHHAPITAGVPEQRSAYRRLGAELRSRLRVFRVST